MNDSPDPTPDSTVGSPLDPTSQTPLDSTSDLTPEPTKPAPAETSPTSLPPQLSNPAPSSAQSSGPTSEEKNWALGVHLSTFLGWSAIPFANLIAPLIVWQVKKDDMPFAARHAKEALNFQISMTIYAFISIILTFILIGFAMLLGLFIMNITCTIIAAIKGNEGKEYRYPLTIRFIN